jgi:hypothetical protein
MNGKPRAIEMRLTPAAAVYRGKLQLRTKADLPKGVVPLPGFRYTTQARKDEADIERVFVKGMIQLIASALIETYGHLQKDLQFVALLKVSIAKPELGFQFHCPFAPLVARVRERLEAWQGALGALDNLRDFTIEYQMGLSPGVRLPLVFHYQPQKRHLLVANKNHLGAPEQFLDPEMCRTTSGLLNFLGALLLLEQLDNLLPHVKRLLTQIDPFLDHGLDEWLRWLFCLAHTQVFFDPARIFLLPDQPEKYFYQCAAG